MRQGHGSLDALRDRCILGGRRALLETVLTRGWATADDVRHLVRLPAGVNPVCLGAVPGVLVQAGIIRRVGFSPSTRAVAHARPVSVWQLVCRETATEWLRGHRTPPSPATGGVDRPMRSAFRDTKGPTAVTVEPERKDCSCEPQTTQRHSTGR